MGAELEALAKLVATLREAGVATYEGPVPGFGTSIGTVKLTVRPLAPTPRPPEQPRRKASDEAQATPVAATPAGMGWRTY